MDPRTISIVRYGTLATIFAFSLIVLGLSGHLISFFTLTVPDYVGLSLATAVITMVAIGVSVGVDIFRKGAFTSMVAIELGWTFFLMILWIASAGDSTSIYGGISCNSFVTFDFFGAHPDTVSQNICEESQALIAFNWLTFFLMFGWHVALIVFTITAVTRGQTSVWTAPVVGTDFFKGNSQAAYGGAQQQQYSGAPVQQQEYTEATMEQTYPPESYNVAPTPEGARV